jgi:hypothetical protein
MLAMSTCVGAPCREAVYLDRFLQAAARMDRAAQFPEILAAAVGQANEFLGPVGGMLVLLDASRRMLVVAALENVPASVMCGNKSLPLAGHLPMADAMNRGRAVWLSAAQRARGYPELAARTPEPYACGSLPLTYAGVPLGLLCLIRMGADAAPPPFDEAERGLAGVLADLVAAGVGRLAGVRESPAGEDTGDGAIGIYEWDPVGDCLYCNADLLTLHGQSALDGDKAGVEAIPGGLPGFSLAAAQLGVRGNGQVVSYPCAAADGQLRLLEARGYRVTGSQNGKPRLVGVVTQASPADGDHASRLARHPASAALLGQLSAALAVAVTVEDFREAAAAALPALGAEGLVIVGQEADRVHVVAGAGITPTVTRERQSLPSPARMPEGRTLSHRVPEYASSTDALLARYPHFQGMLGGLDHHAWAILPLASGYDAPAVCLLAFPPGWSPAGSEQARFLMASGLLAQALDRCRTHDHEHRLVSQMRHGPPAALPGLTLAYGYRPSTSGLGVGGDFYDALLQPGGTPALVIGDVQGHDSRAAAMADRLRTVLRAYALDGHAPAEVMARASRFLAHLNRDRDNAQYATCCYLTVAPGTGRVQICCAGHPRPILVTDGEPATLLTLDAGLPLGVDPDHRYGASAFTLPEDSTLLLYTDGLIERPGADLTLTTSAILRELHEIGSIEPAAILAGLRPLNDPSPRHDDIAVLAARRANHGPVSDKTLG